MFIDITSTSGKWLGEESNVDVPLNSLELWVFDENHLFTKSYTATYEKTSEENGIRKYLFKVELFKSKLPRYVHFAGNYKLSQENEGLWIGRDERTVVPSVRIKDANSFPMWNRVELRDGISEATSFGDVEMKVAVSKLVLNISDQAKQKLGGATEQMQYALYNIRTEGTLAMFDGTSFDNTIITEASGEGTIKKRIQETDFKPVGTPIYLFEQPNNASHNTITPYIVFKTPIKENGQDRINYFKIDMVSHIDAEASSTTEPPIRYDIIRGRYMAVNIQKILDTSGGSSKLEGVYATLPANNFIFSTEAREAPYYSDGVDAIEVWRTLLVIPANNNEKVICYAHFLPNGEKSKNDNVVNKDLFILKALPAPDGGPNPLIKEVYYEGQNITVILKPERKTTYNLRGQVLLQVKGHPKLSRVITYVGIRSYDKDSFNFKASRQRTPGDSDEIIKQGTLINLSFTFPDYFNPDVLPLTAKFYTKDFSPLPGQGLKTVNTNSYKEKYNTYFNYQMTDIPPDRTVKLQFRANKDLPSGTAITVDAEPFNFIVEQDLIIK